MTYRTIEVAIDRGLARLMFCRPKVLNAFDPELIKEVTEALSDFARNDQVHAIMVHGTGRAFSAGFDIKGAGNASGRTSVQWRTLLETDFDFIMQFWDCPKPTIAAVHGYCLGGAFEVMLACDISVAGENALLGEPELRFGSGIVALLLPWMVSPKIAKEVLLTGEDRMTAARAREIGIINHVVPDSDVLSKAEAVARNIIAAAPSSVRMTKRAINRTYEIMGMRQALLQALETDILIEVSGGPERAEFNKIRDEQGLKAAIAWRDARFLNPVDASKNQK